MICMEVLDNLPHDKVIYRDGKFHEVWAVKREEEGGAHNRWSEELRDVSDPLLKRAMDLWCEPESFTLPRVSTKASDGPLVRARIFHIT